MGVAMELAFCGEVSLLGKKKKTIFSYITSTFWIPSVSHDITVFIDPPVCGKYQPAFFLVLYYENIRISHFRYNSQPPTKARTT